MKRMHLLEPGNGLRWAAYGLFIAGLLMVLCGRPVQAQDAENPIPRVEEAETMFSQALQAFEQGEYGIAARRFEEAVTRFDYHQKTTAALLMAGKAYYRAEQYDQAIEVLDELVRNYPTSGYIDEARRVIGYAELQQGVADRDNRVFAIGVALPLNDDNARLAQDVFNGIRLAVDAFNEASGELGASARLVFRDTENDPDRAREAIRELAQEQVDVIIGPLFSEETQAAAEAAEQARVPLMVPLDASDNVAEGRSYVFQANPTLTMRGRVMARFAVRNLRLNDFGVIAEFDNPASERLAEGFQDEVLQQGGEVHHFKLLPGAQAWYQLPQEVTADTLAGIEAVYMPIAGDEETAYASAALNGLDRMGVNIRVLGNNAWHDLPVKTQASKYTTTYANVFDVDADQPGVRDFIDRYRSLTGEVPSASNQRLVYTGYDVARYLLEHLDVDQAALSQALRSAEPYQGLALRFDFRDSTINQGVYYYRYRVGQIERLH